MGQKMTSNKHKLPKGEEVSRNRFEFQNIIGKGGFGKVWKVIDKKQKMHYALKEMTKVKVIDKKSEKSIKYERELLCHLKHPFIVNMYYAFQDYENLYLVMDLLTGGDLRYHICRHRRFTEEQTRFFIACIVLGLEYIHEKNVIHRDIKPENLVLDERGYVRITDFGIAKVFSTKNYTETSGTPGYMSPEVMKGINHTHAVDYFALGVMGYEFMLGYRPYQGKSRKEIKEQMMARQAQIKYNEKPENWSDDSVDFINKLLMRKPEARLGTQSASEVKNHPWLKNFPWKDLYDKTLKAPFTPERRENYDKRYCNSMEKLGIETKSRYEEYKLRNNFQNLFENFTYYPIFDNENKQSEIEENDDRIGIVRKHSLQTSKSKSNLVQYYNKHMKQSASIGDLGFKSPLNKQEHPYQYKNNLNPHKESTVIQMKSNHNKANSLNNSKSIGSFRSYPIKKSTTINLNPSNPLPSSSSTTNILSNGNNDKSQGIRKSQTKVHEADNITSNSNNMIYQKNYVYYNMKNYARDKPTSSSVIKRIRSASQNSINVAAENHNINKNPTGTAGNNTNTAVPTGKTPRQMQRSLSNYGFIYSNNKPLQECETIDIKIIDAPKSTNTASITPTPSSLISNKIPFNHNGLKHSHSSNTVNILLKNYKSNCNSINSTGASLLSNPNAHINSNVNAHTNTGDNNATKDHVCAS